MKVDLEKKSYAERRRIKSTLKFVQDSMPAESKLLDLGTPNDMGAYLRQHGFQVDHAHGVDFDEEPEIIAKEGYDAVTMFEVLEHLINPMGILKAVKAPKLIASVPLDNWFSTAYRNKNDRWDQHFHEFEDWQFEWLLEKSGWKIIRSEKWTSPIGKIGFRPLLRRYTPRYFIVEAERP